MGEIKKVKIENLSKIDADDLKFKPLSQNNEIQFNNQEIDNEIEEYDTSSSNLSIEEIKKLPHVQNKDGSYTVKSKYLGYDAEYTFNPDGSYKLKYTLGKSGEDEKFYDVNGDMYKSISYSNGEIIFVTIRGKDGELYGTSFFSYEREISDDAVISNEDYERIVALAKNNEKLLKEKGMTTSEFIAVYILIEKTANSSLTDSEKAELAVNFAGFENNEKFKNYYKNLLVKVDDKTFKTINGTEASLLGYDKNGKPILYSYDYFINKKDDGVYVTKSDLDNFKMLNLIFGNEEIENVARYFKQVQEFYGDSISEEEKNKIIDDLASKDKENGNKAMHPKNKLMLDIIFSDFAIAEEL